MLGDPPSSIIMSSGGGSSSDRKERLAVFLKEIPRFASLTGFRHFTVYARNREEVVVTTCAFDNEALATSHLLPDSSASDLAPASPISHELPSVTSPSVWSLVGGALVGCCPGGC